MTENKRFKLSEPHGAYLIDIEDDYIVGHWDNDDDKIIELLNFQDQDNKNLRRLFEVADRLIMAHCNDDVKESWVNFQNTKYGDYEMDRRCKYCKSMNITIVPPSTEQYCTKKGKYVKLNDCCVDFFYDETAPQRYKDYGDIE